ncbi:MAG: protein kinase [Herbinix sp.]|nr:protein kinase [Herbinix sp.]
MSFHIRDKIKGEDNYYEKNDTIGEYTIQQLLGEGRYGIVYLALDEKNNKCVVKQLKKNAVKKSKSKLFYEELILKRLQQPYFPRFISNFVDGTREGFIMEYMEGEVFEDILYKDRYRFSKEEILGVCSQLLDIVEQLHSCNIVHRDIRLPNVIRKNPKELSLIDFGLARRMNDTSHTKEEDYWYIGDFLIHLYYTTYRKTSVFERPWYKELELTPEEITLLRRLMGIDETYGSITEIRQQLKKIKTIN